MAFTLGAGRQTAKEAPQTNTYDVVPAGTYPFEVKNVVLKEYKGGAKIKPCIVLNVWLAVEVDANNHPYVFDNIYMDPTHAYNMSKLTTLIESCSMALPDNADERAIANALIGATGHKVEIRIRTYNGTQSNEVVRYIAPELPF